VTKRLQSEVKTSDEQFTCEERVHLASDNERLNGKRVSSVA